MSMSMHCEAIRPPDEKWKKMKAAYEACEAAGTEPPKDVMEFFEYMEPDPTGVRVASVGLHEDREWVTLFSPDGRQGFEIDITKLPKDVTVVRVYCAY